MRKIRSGSISQPQDLDSEIRPDEKIKLSELALIEREANKKKRKRVKAQKNGEMMSPLATSLAASRPSANENRNANNDPFNLGDDDLEEQ